MMNTYLSDFLDWFFPTADLPDWLQVFVGVVLLVLFVKLIIVMIDRR